MDRMAESFQLWYTRISATHNVLSDQEGIGGMDRTVIGQVIPHGVVSTPSSAKPSSPKCHP